MRSHYKRIGDYISLVDIRNTGLKESTLIGLSINKEFISSVANTIGTDMANYKIIKKGQFACSLMQVRRDKKIPVSLLKIQQKAIISPAYSVFEIFKQDELLPEYLMMWMSRSEFDRHACFLAVGGVRGSLEWDDFCDMTLPFPCPDKQREIIREYNTIVERIKLNEQLNLKLEETAQALYKQWFVDFEFPISKEYAESIGKPELEGKPYKSSGGGIVYDESIELEIPIDWHVSNMDNIVERFISHRGKSKLSMDISSKSNEFKNPVISAMNVNSGKIVKHDSIRYVSDADFESWMVDKLKTDDVLMTSEAPLGELYYVAKKTNFVLSQRLFAIRTDRHKLNGSYLYYWMKTAFFKREMDGRASGTTAQGIRLSELKKCCVIQPRLNLLKLFEERIISILFFQENIADQNAINNELKDILLARLSSI